MIEIVGTALHQWDVGRYVQVTGIEVEYVHFANKGDSKAVIVGAVDIKAKIPDHLLQTGKQLCVYAVKDGITVESKIFYVKNREKPDDYVYEEEERDFIYALITNAEKATQNAQQAAGVANTAAASANTATASANTAASSANAAAASANTAAGNVNTAIKNANDAATKANQTAKSLMVIGSAEGENIQLDDAIDQYIVGLRIFGKSTQDGTPTPEAPVDIASVENPTVTVNDQTLLVPYTLHGIPVTTGGNYTDANGQQWICDEIDLSSGVHVKRIHKITSQQMSTLGTFGTHDNGVPFLSVWSQGLANKTAPLSTRYEGWISSTLSGRCYCTTDGLVVNDIRFTDQSTARSIMSSEDSVFLCQLTNPVETPLSEEELAAFAALHTYRGDTAVSNDASAHMEIEYAMDAKKYIDRLVGASFVSTATVE